MRKICLTLAAAAAVFSNGAFAQTTTFEFTTRRECQRWVNWDAWYAKYGMANPMGDFPPNPRCEKIGGKWVIVAG